MHIANRGEIVCRVIKTASRTGIWTVAVHSDTDTCAPFVQMTDGRAHIGPLGGFAVLPDGRMIVIRDKERSPARSRLMAITLPRPAKSMAVWRPSS
ncbi:MAG: hypothetical protein E2586_02535 [Novosphingobium sp.]|nr:hypothetical protein [Novosphingobium sp.]